MKKPGGDKDQHLNENSDEEPQEEDLEDDPIDMFGEIKGTVTVNQPQSNLQSEEVVGDLVAKLTDLQQSQESLEMMHMYQDNQMMELMNMF